MLMLENYNFYQNFWLAEGGLSDCGSEKDLYQWNCRIAMLELDRELIKPNLEEYKKWMFGIYRSLISYPKLQTLRGIFNINYPILAWPWAVVTRRGWEKQMGGRVKRQTIDSFAQSHLWVIESKWEDFPI